MGMVSRLAMVFVCTAASGAAAQQTAASGEFNCVMTPREVVELGSAANGVLKEILVQPGDVVEKGQVLARLDDEVEKATVELARLRASNNFAIESGRQRTKYFGSSLERARSLYEKNVTTLERMEKAETEGKLAEFELKRAELERRMVRVELKRAEALLKMKSVVSPFDGVVMDRKLSPGAFVHEQSVLMTLAEVDPLIVEVFLPVRLYNTISVGQVGRILPNEPVGGVYEAQVLTVDPVFDAASGTFRVRLELPNADRSIPGGVRCRVSFASGA